jgi:glucose/arabinose dehydrogenase
VKKNIILGFVLLGMALVSTGLAPKTLDAPVLNLTEIMADLEYPWDLAFTPDKAMLYTERCLGLSVKRIDGTTARLFGKTNAAVAAPDLFCEGQSGMNGVAIDH